MLIPLDYRLPPKLLHIEKWCNGNYNESLDEIAENIKNTLILNGFNVWYKSTDGDRFLSNDHELFYQNYVDRRSSDFLKLVNEIYTILCNHVELTIPIGDPLHLWKGIRSRFQMNRIALFSESPFMTDFENVSRILDLGNAILDTSKAGKMRNAYCLKMFTFENTIKLLREQDFIDACFFLPFASWISANFSISIDLPFRLFLFELSFQMISTFFEQFPDLKKTEYCKKLLKELRQ